MYNCTVVKGKTPKIYQTPSVYSPSGEYLGSGRKFIALQVKTDVTDPKRPGKQVWLEMEDGRWTFAEYPRGNGSPEIFVTFSPVGEEPPPPIEEEPPTEIPVVVSVGATVKIGNTTYLYQAESITVIAKKA